MSIKKTNYKSKSFQLFVGTDTVDYGKYITSADYSKVVDFAFGYSLGDNLPVERNEGDVTSEGTITFLTGGLEKLNDYARSLGYDDYLGLPLVQIIQINEKYDGTLSEVILNDCKFTSYGLNYASGTLIAEIDVPVMIGSITAATDF